MNHITATLILLVTVLFFRHSRASAESQLTLIQHRLLNMLRAKQRVHFKRNIRGSRRYPNQDMREHRLFQSDPQLDCCPTLTEYISRTTGVNRQGMVLDLLQTNETQKFYETVCHPNIRFRPCQYIDPRIAYATRCVQQYSYVYAVGRREFSDQYELTHVRIPSGCKCKVVREFLKKKRKKRDMDLGSVDDAGSLFKSSNATL